MLCPGVFPADDAPCFSLVPCLIESMAAFIPFPSPATLKTAAPTLLYMSPSLYPLCSTQHRTWQLA